MATKRNATLDSQHIQRIEEDVLNLTENTLNQEFPEQYFPVAVQFEKEFGHWNLRIYVDRSSHQKDLETKISPISLKNCEDISRLLNPLLDELKSLEPLTYNVEVSSPGLFRELKTEREFAFYQGRSIKVEKKMIEKKLKEKKNNKEKNIEKNVEEENELETPAQHGFIKAYNPESKVLTLSPLSQDVKNEQPTENNLIDINLSLGEPHFLVTLNPQISKT